MAKHPHKQGNVLQKWLFPFEKAAAPEWFQQSSGFSGIIYYQQRFVCILCLAKSTLNSSVVHLCYIIRFASDFDSELYLIQVLLFPAFQMYERKGGSASFVDASAETSFMAANMQEHLIQKLYVARLVAQLRGQSWSDGAEPIRAETALSSSLVGCSLSWQSCGAKALPRFPFSVPLASRNPLQDALPENTLWREGDILLKTYCSLSILSLSLSSPLFLYNLPFII